MNTEIKMDLRVKKTRQAIKNAFKELVCETDDISQITVKALSERAQINRKTFYLHYTCIEALFENILQDITLDYFHEIDKLPLPMTVLDINKVFFTHLATQDEFIEKLLCSPNYSDFRNNLFKVNLKHNRDRYNPYAGYSQEEQNIINTFLVSSSFDMYRQWVIDGRKISLSRIIELSGILLSNGVSALL